jgi:hypothetical protein
MPYCSPTKSKLKKNTDFVDTIILCDLPFSQNRLLNFDTDYTLIYKQKTTEFHCTSTATHIIQLMCQLWKLKYYTYLPDKINDFLTFTTQQLLIYFKVTYCEFLTHIAYVSLRFLQ